MPPTPEGRSTPPRLADIAARAGVSKSLTSLALRGENGVSEDARRRVLDAARSLGRHVTPHALRMLGGTEMIGVLVTDLRNPFHVEVVLGIENEADRSSVHVVNGARDIERMRGQLREFDTLGVAGVVIVSSWLPGEDVARAGSRRPVVVIGSTVNHTPGTDTVRGDMRVGIRETVEHLVASGHRRIGFVAESERSSSRVRHAAFLEQTSRFLNDTATGALHIDDLAADPAHLARLTRDRGVTAYIAANDVTAIAFMGVAERAGLRVPEDLAVAGYDNTTSSRLVRPALTTVDQPWERMGERAFQMIRERTLGRSADREEVVTPHLVPRGSTAPVSRG
ncbi:LacI family DNA-binding transcriptional regulator [Microbacterium sp. SSW1-59]|uniref:LacI family DNA-binding transcriptional regulator n=1 Tax=Microbacterium xanthum TaxID=3079794 RepID=UPI002AD3B5E5|nr:LacI family DNA-binding transcriptional regulator [Microbacterium sp. SSW1-59]MDZ8201228.1 LacI family DNA-binding transcriptional regulator [Microbacterium sp. SSW1-59]